MTISSELLKLQNNLEDSYTACNAKGATMPANQNFDNLPNCINSISSGMTLVSKTITTNGTYNPREDDADGYSSVTVNVSGILEGLWADIVAGNNPVNTTALSNIETMIQG